jgi:hypothetical protein
VSRSTVTFVGPLTASTGAPLSYHPWHFYVLQSGAPLKLEYPNKDVALSARRIIMTNPNTHSVQTKALLDAIAEALALAAAGGGRRQVA